MARLPLYASTMLAVILAGPAHAEEIRFALPIACEPGTSCFVQNYFDRDPGPGARDFACGAMTYDGHDGTDFRILSMAAERRGVAVLAAFDGRVTRTRDGMADVGLAGIRPEELKGRECGNAVVIEHADGWQTQYCHMAFGSIRVQPGQEVKTGTPLGLVGLSGNTEFPHVHLTIRHDGKPIDPFAPDPAAACGPGPTLWRDDVAASLAYRSPSLLNAGFTPTPPSGAEIESGEVEDRPVRPDWPAIIVYVRAIGLAKGDVQTLELNAPDGTVLARQVVDPLDRPKAQYVSFNGRKRAAGSWPVGRYRGLYTVVRDGRPVLEREFTSTLVP